MRLLKVLFFTLILLHFNYSHPIRGYFYESNAEDIEVIHYLNEDGFLLSTKDGTVGFHFSVDEEQRTVSVALVGRGKEAVPQVISKSDSRYIILFPLQEGVSAQAYFKVLKLTGSISRIKDILASTKSKTALLAKLCSIPLDIPFKYGVVLFMLSDEPITEDETSDEDFPSSSDDDPVLSDDINLMPSSSNVDDLRGLDVVKRVIIRNNCPNRKKPAQKSDYITMGTTSDRGTVRILTETKTISIFKDKKRSLTILRDNIPLYFMDTEYYGHVALSSTGQLPLAYIIKKVTSPSGSQRRWEVIRMKNHLLSPSDIGFVIMFKNSVSEEEKLEITLKLFDDLQYVDHSTDLRALSRHLFRSNVIHDGSSNSNKIDHILVFCGSIMVEPEPILRVKDLRSSQDAILIDHGGKYGKLQRRKPQETGNASRNRNAEPSLKFFDY